MAFFQRRQLPLKVTVCVCLALVVYLCNNLFFSSSTSTSSSVGGIVGSSTVGHFVPRYQHKWDNDSNCSSSVQLSAEVQSPDTETADVEPYTTEDGDCNIRNILASGFSAPEALQSLQYCKRVFYNRVPKCGSRTVLSTFKTLARKQRYGLIDEERWNNVNILGTRLLRARFAKNFTAHQEPFLFSQHVHYLDFTVYRTPPPVYINVIREPIDRLASHFYYNEYGSFSAPKETVKTNMTLDECVKRSLHKCLNINVVLPFFCGHTRMCQQMTVETLQMAKRNLLRDFLVVGLQEDLPAFMELLEIFMPKFFSGAPKVFSALEDELKAKYSTVKRPEVQKETVRLLKNRYRYEYDFYYFVKAHFYNTLSSMRTRHFENFGK